MSIRFLLVAALAVFAVVPQSTVALGAGTPPNASANASPGAAPGVPPQAGQGSGLPLPRFVSLRASEVNMRIGPGVRYPVDWVYKRQQLPVEVIAEFGTWRKVRDGHGTQGWIHQSMLSSHRSLQITGRTRTLRSDAESQSVAVARVEPGVIGQLLECPESIGWCRVKVGRFEGWLRRAEFWGAHPGEAVNGSRPLERANFLLNLKK